MTEVFDILRKTNWNAGLEYYDFLCALAFTESEVEMKAGSGQSLHFQETHPFSLVGPDSMNLGGRTIIFELLEGEFTVKEPYSGPQKYRYLLKFHESPFPLYADEYESVSEFLEFYGWHLKL